VLFHDGLEYFNDGHLDNVLDNLISENRIQPVIAVFVPPKQRNDEYAFNLTSQFESFILDELMPVIDSKYRTKDDPSCRAMVGYSYGGLIATQICYNHPEIFGLCAPQSPSYVPKDYEVYRNVINGVKKNIKFYIDWGFYDFRNPTDIMEKAILLRNNLLVLGYEVLSNQWPEGHNIGNWRAHVDNILEYFFPANSGGLTDEKPGLNLIKCYPNPFIASTLFEYILDKPGFVTLAIFNHLGQQVALLVDGEQVAGLQKVQWKAEGLPSGIYFYRLTTGCQSSTGKMVVLK
jgi:hypothetical protein